MDRHLKVTILVWVAVLLSMPAPARGEEPMDALQRYIDHGIGVLSDPQHEGLGQRHVQYLALVALFKQSFDFEEFSRLVLGSYWQAFTPAQRKEFTHVLKAFLIKFYVREAQEKYGGERVACVRQTKFTDTRAQVGIDVLWKGPDIPVQVRMVFRDGRWKVYDVIILGISGMKNYRAQFTGMLSRKSPEQVIEVLAERVQQLETRIQ